MEQSSRKALSLVGLCALLIVLGWGACQPLFQCTKDNHCPNGLSCLAQQCQAISSEPLAPDAREPAQESVSETPTTPQETAPDTTVETIADGPTPCTPSAEVCNGKDDDCDGLLDEKTCGANGICVKGTCHDESQIKQCNITSDCKADQSCVRQGETNEPGICLAKCDRDTDCPGYTKCMLSACLFTASCSNDAVCGEGRKCIQAQTGYFVCLPDKYECTNDLDCTDNKFCAVGKCVQ